MNGVYSVSGLNAVWSEKPCRLREFASDHGLPAVARVLDGQYRNIGSGVMGQGHQVVYIHSVQSGQKVLGEGIRQNGRSLGRTRMNFSLPVTYGGWFELLSEDGKPIMPLPGVDELVKLFPQQCLVRETFKVPFCDTHTDEFQPEKLRQVNVGEMLNLHVEVDITFPAGKGATTKKRFLKCKDEHGCFLFLALDLRVQFSPVAGPNNISGVHNIKGLLEKFRLPIIVRLVHGIIPARMEKNFTPIFRLVGAYTDEIAFVFPLPVRKDSKMVTISTRESLLLAGAENWKSLCETSEIKSCMSKCSSSVKNYLNSIHVLVDLPDLEAITRGKEQLEQRKPRMDGTAENGTGDDKDEEKLLFEEIEEIYRYVREGGDPPLPRNRPSSVRTSLRSDALETQEAMLDMSDGLVVTTPNDVTGEAVGQNQKHEASFQKDVRPEEEDYWEEPIYEDIAKIRERKQAIRRNDDGNSSLKEQPLQEALHVQKLEATSGSRNSPSVLLSGQTVRPVDMVHSLREVFTRNSSSPIRPASSRGLLAATMMPEVVALGSQAVPEASSVHIKRPNHEASTEESTKQPEVEIGKVAVAGIVSKPITESSGVVSSRDNPSRTSRPKSQPPKVPPKTAQKKSAHNPPPVTSALPLPSSNHHFHGVEKTLKTPTPKATTARSESPTQGHATELSRNISSVGSQLSSAPSVKFHNRASTIENQQSEMKHQTLPVLDRDFSNTGMSNSHPNATVTNSPENPASSKIVIHTQPPVSSTQPPVSLTQPPVSLSTQNQLTSFALNQLPESQVPPIQPTTANTFTTIHAVANSVPVSHHLSSHPSVSQAMTHPASTPPSAALSSHISPAATTTTFPDILPSGPPESPSNQFNITNSTSQTGWPSGTGNTVHIGVNPSQQHSSSSSSAPGVTMIRVSGVRTNVASHTSQGRPGFPGTSFPGNTQVFVRPVNQAPSRPGSMRPSPAAAVAGAATPGVLRVNSGVILANNTTRNG